MSIPNIAPITKEIELPSDNRKIKIRPYNVAEEEALGMAASGESREDIFNCVRDLIKNCVLTTDIDTEKFAIFDLEYLFVQIRSLSVGSIVSGYIICKDDNETQVPYTVDYSELKVTKPKGHKKSIKLSNGYIVDMRYPSIEFMVDRMTSMTENIKPRELNRNQQIAECISRIHKGDEIYDRPTQSDKDFKVFLDNLIPRDRSKLMKFFSTMPEMVHDFKVVNPKTQKESEYRMTGLEAFFLLQPSEE